MFELRWNHHHSAASMYSWRSCFSILRIRVAMSGFRIGSLFGVTTAQSPLLPGTTASKTPWKGMVVVLPEPLVKSSKSDQS